MENVSEQVILERETEKEYMVSDDQNLLVLLIFANDFKLEMIWLAQTLKAPYDSIKETARILQGYGYLVIVKTDEKEYLRVTRKGKYLVAKIRSKLKAP